MLKSVSSVANAIGALNYKGTWNATTNTPALASGSGTKGDYYQVSVAGSTALDGISNWGVGDVAAFNGTTWQRIEGGADLNGVNLSISGISTLAENTTITNGNLILGTAGKGIDFSANSHATGMTSELLDDYEKGTWTPAFEWFGSASTGLAYTSTGTYVKVGDLVHYYAKVTLSNKGSDSGIASITNVPFSGTFTTIVDPITAFIGLVAGGATFTLAAGPGILFLAQQTTTSRNVMTETSFNTTAIFELYGTCRV